MLLPEYGLTFEIIILIIVIATRMWVTERRSVMAACAFFGHKECTGLDRKVLLKAIESLILQGTDAFYVGNQGGFDRMVYGCLKQLRKQYSHICAAVVLACLPTGEHKEEDMSDAIYPEIEGHPRFAIERRNRWMIEMSDDCICYVTHTWGGAYKFARQAKRRGLRMMNLGNENVVL